MNLFRIAKYMSKFAIDQEDDLNNLLDLDGGAPGVDKESSMTGRAHGFAKKAQPAEAASHIIFVSSFGFGGKFRTDVRITDVATSQIVESKGFEKPEDDPEVLAYIQALQAKYPGAQIKKKSSMSLKNVYAKDWEAYFKEKLSEYGVENLADLTPDQKKKFFDDVDLGWKSKEEQDAEDHIPGGLADKPRENNKPDLTSNEVQDIAHNDLLPTFSRIEAELSALKQLLLKGFETGQDLNAASVELATYRKTDDKLRNFLSELKGLRDAVSDEGNQLYTDITGDFPKAASSLNHLKLALKKEQDAEDHIPGGLADNANPKDFDPSALAKGVKVELEHTSDPAIAEEIAMDHLTEDPKYYDKLELVEDPLFF